MTVNGCGVQYNTIIWPWSIWSLLIWPWPILPWPVWPWSIWYWHPWPWPISLFVRLDSSAVALSDHLRHLHDPRDVASGQHADRHDGSHLRLRQWVTQRMAPTGTLSSPILTSHLTQPIQRGSVEWWWLMLPLAHTAAVRARHTTSPLQRPWTSR